MEEAFEGFPGILSVVSGYTGGTSTNPTYETVSQGETGHAEVIKIEFDSSIISYQTLLDIFWRNIDPTTKNRQFCDEGNQYRSEIFTSDEAQKIAAEDSKKKIGVKFKDVATKISSAQPFYAAEEYHQDYYAKNPIRYKTYKYSCGREQRLSELWGKTEERFPTNFPVKKAILK